MTAYVALMRGINVGTAKQVSMPALKQTLVELGLGTPQTLLRSGNVVFNCATKLSPTFADDIETAVLSRTGVQSSVVLFTGSEFAQIAHEDPLGDVATDPSRHVIAFASQPIGSPDGIQVPDPDTLAPEVLTIGRQAIYQWCPDGISKSDVKPAFWKQFEGVVTARNRRTVDKLLAIIAHQ